MLTILPRWVITLGGVRLNPMELRDEEIHVIEVAHALANINRFNGHSRYPINVAQHSVCVSRLCGAGVPGRQGLFHDASEYLLGDITKWLKHTAAFDAYREVEDHVQAVLYRHFACPPEMLPPVREADVLMCRVEAEWAWGPHWSDVPGYGPLTEAERARIGPWEPWTWSLAKWEFLKRYEEVR